MIRAEDNVILESQKGINDTANEAHTIASNTEQHFWVTESGSDTGAHITEKTKEAFLADPQNGGSNLLARSNGVAVRDGLTELATYGASGVQVGKTGSSHVNVGASSISMSDGQNTVYEVKQASNPIVMTKVFNRSVASAFPSSLIRETIALGREVSSWEKITMNCTLKRGGQTYTYSPTYTSAPITDDNANYYFHLWSYGSNCYIEFGDGSGYQEGDSLVLNSIKLEFNTSQIAIESTIGANANTDYGGVFRVGKGAGQVANALLLDWAGNLMVSGDVIVNCEGDSSGGISLTEIRTTPFAYEYNSETAVIEIDVFQVGMMVTLEILIANFNKTASGANIAYPSLANAHIPTPVGLRATGASYYGNHAVGLVLSQDNSNVWRITCRNASPSAVTVSGFVIGTLTYMWDGGYTDGGI